MAKIFLLPAIIAASLMLSIETVHTPDEYESELVYVEVIQEESVEVCELIVQDDLEVLIIDEVLEAIHDEATVEEEVVEVEVLTEEIPEANWWTQEEYDLLCRIVTLEMGSDYAPDEAQQGVAAVVINRVRHPSFANTIRGVIYEKNQYSGTSRLYSVTPSEKVKANTLIALQGNSGFPSDVVWQSSKPQSAWGTAIHIYKVFYTTPYTTYFCHYGA